MANDRILEQVRRNAVALISLVIAITSLGYNTWRNEHTENNRNKRWASFEILLALGELRELVYLNYWDCNTTLRGNIRTGWVVVQTIEDLSWVFEDMSADSATQLKGVWEINSPNIDYNNVADCKNRPKRAPEPGFAAWEAIRAAIDLVRQDVLKTLHSLD